MMKGEAFKKEFAKVNPLKKIPVLQEVNTDSGLIEFTLSESHAMLRYLADKNQVAEHWYPRQDLQKRAKIDEYLDSHHKLLRFGVYGQLRELVVEPFFNKKKKKPTMEEVQVYQTVLHKALDDLERRLQNQKGKKYLFGDQISIADLSAAHELETGTLFMEIELKKWPRVEKWMIEVIDNEPINLKMV